MRNKYTVYTSRYPCPRRWEIEKEGFETLDETIEYVKQRQLNGYKILNIKSYCRFTEVWFLNNRRNRQINRLFS